MVSLAPKTTLQPVVAKSKTIYLPIPLLPPVTTANFPCKLGLSPVYMVPLKYLSMMKRRQAKMIR